MQQSNVCYFLSDSLSNVLTSFLEAYGRVHRIGQENETAFLQLSVRGTIDDHMAKVKDRKQREIDRFSSLGDEELLAIFGWSGKKKDGLFVVEDSDHGEECESESESEDEESEE